MRLYKGKGTLKKHSRFFVKEKDKNLTLKTEKIINLNPLQTLSRGYSITRKDGDILKDTNSLKVGDEVKTNLYNGTFISVIKEINNI